MTNLSAPTVWEPLYECAGSVIVSGYVPGADVQIFAAPPAAGPQVQIGGGISNSASGQGFGVAVANIVAGARIIAVQKFGPDTSPPLPEAVLPTAPSVHRPR